MNTKGFSDEQKAALLDLLVLAMYQDNHLAAAENERVKILLAGFDLPSDYARQQLADASFNRINKHPQTPEAVRSVVFDCAAKFKNEAQRRQALDALAELLACDDHITIEENKFLAVVQQALKIGETKN